MTRAGSIQKLRRAHALAGPWVAGLALVLASGSAAVAGSVTGMPASGRPLDISRTPMGAALAAAAGARLSTLGAKVAPVDLAVWRDAAGVLVAPRGAALTRMPARGQGSAVELVPMLGAATPAFSGPRGAIRTASDESPRASWSLAASACYERISDTWAWLDHCARIYRLDGDGDPLHDYYGLQRVATAGSNAPWVLKSASISAAPVDPTLMAWMDWSPRNDRGGACQPFLVRVTVPAVGMALLPDRCETWDITKGIHGGDFRLDWYGCACTHDRALAFDVSVSVPEGRTPGWYVPAAVHGFAF